MNRRNAPLVIALCAAIVAAGLHAAPDIQEIQKGQKWHVIVDKVPASLEEFRAFRDAIAVTPQGGIVAYLVAHLIMTGNQDLGEQCLVLTLDTGQLVETAKVPKYAQRPNVAGWQLGSMEVMRLQSSGFVPDKAYAAKSFVKGTKTANAYALPPLPYTYVITRHSQQSADPDEWRGFANTSCQDLGYVPFHVSRTGKGLWKVSNSSSFYSGCIDPPKGKKQVEPADDVL